MRSGAAHTSKYLAAYLMSIPVWCPRKRGWKPSLSLAPQHGILSKQGRTLTCGQRAQVVKASYVWLPLLPRLDGLGYELVYADRWSPSEFRERARIPVVYNNGTSPESIPISRALPYAQGSSSPEVAGAAAEVRHPLPSPLLGPSLTCKTSLVSSSPDRGPGHSSCLAVSKSLHACH